MQCIHIRQLLNMDYPETIIFVPGNKASCSGEPEGDHPLVYLSIPEGGQAVCGYCDTKYRSQNELPKRHEV